MSEIQNFLNKLNYDNCVMFLDSNNVAIAFDENGEIFVFNVSDFENIQINENFGLKLLGALGKFRNIINKPELAKKLNLSKLGIAVFKSGEKIKDIPQFVKENPKKTARFLIYHSIGQAVVNAAVPVAYLPPTLAAQKTAKATTRVLDFINTPNGQKIEKHLIHKIKTAPREVIVDMIKHPKQYVSFAAKMTKKAGKFFGNYAKKHPIETSIHAATQVALPVSPPTRLLLGMMVHNSSVYVKKNKGHLLKKVSEDTYNALVKLARTIKNSTELSNPSDVTQKLLAKTGVSKQEYLKLLRNHLKKSKKVIKTTKQAA